MGRAAKGRVAKGWAVMDQAGTGWARMDQVGTGRAKMGRLGTGRSVAADLPPFNWLVVSVNMGVWQGVAMNSLKYSLLPPWTPHAVRL
jgi:hypothetical protein